ncbi:MAG: Wzz/FepE/Etk N-terminal domain-containing protein [Dehalococcoidia bacterium]
MDQQDFQLLHYLHVIWRRKWIIVTTTAIFVAAAVLLSMVSEPEEAAGPVYVASATILVEQPVLSPSSNPAHAVLATSGVTDLSLQTHLRLMQSRTVLENAVRKAVPAEEVESWSPARMASEVDMLRGAIQVVPLSGTNLVEIRVFGPNPQAAEQRADGLVGAYVDYLRNEQRRVVQEALTGVRQNLDDGEGELPMDPGTLAVLASVVADIDALRGSLETNADELANLDLSGAGSGGPTFASVITRITGAAADLESTGEGIQRVEDTQPTPAEPTLPPLPLTTFTGSSSSLRDASTLISPLAVGSSSLADRLTPIHEQLGVIIVELERAVNDVSGEGQQNTPENRRRLADQARSSSTALDVISSDMAQIRSSGIATPTQVGQLLTAQTRIGFAASSLESIIGSLESEPEPIRQSALVTQLGRIRLQSTDVAEGLRTVATLLEAYDEDPEAENRRQVAESARERLDVLQLDLDVTSRQMDAVSSSVSDPLLQGQVSALGSRIGTALTATSESMTRLDSMLSSNDLVLSDAVQLAHQRIMSSASGLQRSSELLSQLDETTTSQVARRTADDVAIRLTVAASGLIGASADLESAASDIQPGLRNEILLISQRSVGLADRIESSSRQLESIGTAAGSDSGSLVQLRRELELLLVSPLETGITVVDSAVATAQPQGSDSLLMGGVDVRIPVAAFGGLVVGILAALGLDVFDKRVSGPDRLRLAGDLYSLGTLPRIRRGRKSAGVPTIKENPTSAFAESMQLLTTNVQYALQDGSHLILVTGPSGGEGATTVAMNLAEGLARRHLRVLLVDANLWKPDASKLMGFSGTAEGLATALESSIGPASYIATNGSGVDVLPAGRTGVSRVETLSSVGLDVFLDWANDRYDAVVVDGAPTLGFAETVPLAQKIGRAVMVLDMRSTTYDSVRDATQALELAGARVMGAVLNFAKADSIRQTVTSGARASNGRG